MAIGLGVIMGFDLGVNFDHPFRSLNITEFWRSIWDNPPPSLDPPMAGQRPLSSKRETSRPAHIALTTRLTEEKRDS